MSVYTLSPRVMHETLDGETIVIDLSTGTYFSLRGSAPAIWHALETGASCEAILDRLEHHYDAAREELAEASDAFLAQLEAENLIVGNPHGGEPATEPAIFGAETRAAFEPPLLEKYEDMQDIILLDPVHMVDDHGWPHPAGGPAA